MHQVDRKSKNPKTAVEAAAKKQARAKSKKEAQERAKLAARAQDPNCDPYADSSDDDGTADT